ncbi:MAG: hypothetical protein LRS43_04845, partial [Desulfurococcales archaeon]|nr:hypothetical protein [Desulfurococcales archaeon]
MYNAGGHGGSMVAVIVDMNQDFLQLPLPPGRQTLEDPVYERVFKGVRPPSSLLAVFPLPGVAVRNAIEVGGRGDVEDIIKGVASEYAREAFTPLTGHEVPREVVLFRRHGLLGARVEMGFNLIMVPYAINTMGMDSEKMATLLPGLSL